MHKGARPRSPSDAGRTAGGRFERLKFGCFDGFLFFCLTIVDKVMFAKKGILSSPYQRGKKAVSSPPAQFGTLLQRSEQDEKNYNILKDIAQAGTGKYGVYSVGVDLMLAGGLRLSEILSADRFFVTPLGQVLVKGRKGSADKLVTPLFRADFWAGSRGWVANPFNFSSRWSWYRFFRANGVVMSESGKEHKSVTHVPRKLLAHSLFVNGVELESVADVVGHRSSKSTEYYKPKGSPGAK